MSHRRLHIAIIMLGGAIGSLIAFPQVLLANPEGGTVVQGTASIGVNPDNPQHQIINQASDKAIIDWRSFNIGSQEVAQFIQPSAQAIALNRVIGGDPSTILGTLRANGQVWLINPAGILFGRSAVVDVAGLLATTANISNQDFMSGNHHFLQPIDRSTSVVNQGHITAREGGMAALVAPGVQNSGVIEANLGKVVLASGTEYTVDLYGDNLIHFAASQPALLRPITDTEGRFVKDAVTNSGQLLANGGKILLTTADAKQMVDHLINMTGVVKANTVVEKAGKIILQGAGEGVVKQGPGPQEALVKVTGKIEAQGKKGGEVIITGKRTGLFERAEIDASGEEGGGKVLVGGDWQGRNTGIIPWAEAVFMGPGARIRADALRNGNGGTAVLWSEKCTRFYGDISAKGGREGGNGGKIETSAHWVDPKGKVNTSAPRGLAGEWLLDPYNIDIGDFVDTNGAFAGDPTTTQVWTPTGDNSLISNEEINNYLNAGVNVHIRTAGAGVQVGNIGIDGFIQKTHGLPATLTLEADNYIIFARSVDLSPDLTLVLIANAVFTSGTASINVGALQLDITTNTSPARASIGNPEHIFPQPPFIISFPAAHSYVNGDDTGSNIVLLNPGAVQPGTLFFNGNDLFQFIPPPPPTTTTTATATTTTTTTTSSSPTATTSLR